MLSKEDNEGRVTIMIPPDQTITGHSSNGKHTTFFTRDKRHSYRTRNISEQEAGWFMAVPGTIIAMCAYLAWAFSNNDPKPVSDAMFPFGIIAFAMLAIGLRNGGFALKETVMLVAAGQLCLRPISLHDSDAVLAFAVIAVLLVWYAVWWARSAVWEPFACSVLFFGWLLACRFGLVPNHATGPIFAMIGFVTFFWTCGIAGSAETYRKGWSRMSD